MAARWRAEVQTERFTYGTFEGHTTEAGGLSAKAVALAEGVVEGMAMTKPKIGLVLALALGVVMAGTGAVAHQVLGRERPEPEQRTAKGGPGAASPKPPVGEQPARTDRY